MADGEIVYVSLSWSYGVRVAGQLVYFGPGDRVPVPADVAERMGWRPLDEAEEVRAQTPPAAKTAVPRAVSALEVANASGVPHLADGLTVAGFDTAESIRNASEAQLTAVSGIGKATAAKLKAAAEELLA